MDSPLRDSRYYDSESDYSFPSDIEPIYDGWENNEDDESCEELETQESLFGDASNKNPDASEGNKDESKDTTKGINDIIRGWKFDNIEEAEDLYKAYALKLGFNVRRQSSKRRPCGMLRYMLWVCSCEGFYSKEEVPQREAKTETRCGCKARFRVAHDLKEDVYKVTDFKTEHNHDLEDIRSLKQNRSLAPSDKFILAEMTDAGIRPCLVMDYLEVMLGEVGELHFKRKDGYNYLHKRQREMIKGGDVNTALSMLEGIKEVDEGFVYEHNTTIDGALGRLFWCDSMSKAEFETFGDILCMDSTYMTNEYRFPLVFFSGVDNHYNTCLFGAAVLFDETIQSYRWLLRTFKKAMNDSVPSAVLTDQDASMAEAILQEWKGTRHRLCSWHLLRNARQNVKNTDFVSDFGYLLRNRCSPEEFESSWAEIIEKYDLGDNAWASGIYEKREYWADAYFKGVFLAGMRSTQRSESMNSCMKVNVKRTFKLTQLFKQYNRKVRRMRAVFIEKQRDTLQNKLPFKKVGLEKLEQHAAEMCTKKIFQRVRDQIRKEQDLVEAKKIQISDYHYEFRFHPYDMRNGKHFDVTVMLDDDKFLCDCGKLEFGGVPCSHIIAALKRIGLTKFPRNSIHPRWTIAAGMDLKDRFPCALPESNTHLVRFGRFQKEWANLALESSKVIPRYDVNLDKVKKLAVEIGQDMQNANRCEDHMNTFTDEGQRNDRKANVGLNVRDPEKINSRGAPKGSQRCSLCHSTVVNFGRLHLSRYEIKSLRPKNLVIGSVIDCVGYMASMNDKLKNPEEPSLFLSTRFADYVLNDKYGDTELVDMFLKENEVFKNEKLEKVYIPINDMHGHWYLAIIDFFIINISICDTRPAPTMLDFRKNQVTKLANKIGQLIGKGEISNKFFYEYPKWVPLQANVHDCGLYVCLMLLIGDKMNKEFDKEDSVKARRKLAIDLYTDPSNSVAWDRH